MALQKLSIGVQALDTEKDKILNLDNSEKLEMIKNHQNLDVLIDDEDWRIRMAVAEQGYGLDKLINDKDSGIRAVVAKQGYGLDQLINDKSYYVRKTVAEQGYGLEKLINDENYDVSYLARILLKQKKE